VGGVIADAGAALRRVGWHLRASPGSRCDDQCSHDAPFPCGGKRMRFGPMASTITDRRERSGSISSAGTASLVLSGSHGQERGILPGWGGEGRVRGCGSGLRGGGQAL
jgi:hypothetical protein